MSESLKIESVKTALLGTSGTGKTSAFAAFFLEARQIVAFPETTAEERLDYRQKSIDRLVQVRLSVPDTELKKTLKTKAAPLLRSPIAYPDPSDFLHKARLDLQFDFIPLVAGNPRIHKRSIEIYDSTGEALTGEHKDSDAIRKELESCDVAIVFLSTKDLLAAAKAKTPRQQKLAKSNLSFADIMKPLENMQAKMDALDAFPFCVVLSQCDEAKTDEDRRLTKKALSDIIGPISRQKPNMQIGICPISLQSVAPVKENPDDADDKGAYEYEPVNVEWPFLFAVMAVEQRKAKLQVGESLEAARDAEKAEREANRLRELYEQNPIGYALNHLVTRMNHPLGFFDGAGDSFVREKSWADIKRYQEKEANAMADAHNTLKNEIETAFYQHAYDKGLSIIQEGITRPDAPANDNDRELKYA